MSFAGVAFRHARLHLTQRGQEYDEQLERDKPSEFHDLAAHMEVDDAALSAETTRFSFRVQPWRGPRICNSRNLVIGEDMRGMCTRVSGAESWAPQPSVQTVIP